MFSLRSNMIVEKNIGGVLNRKTHQESFFKYTFQAALFLNTVDCLGVSGKIQQLYILCNKSSFENALN